MKRLVPTAVVGFALLMLFFRGATLVRSDVGSSQNSTEAFGVVDETIGSFFSFGAESFPLATMLAGVALVLFLGAVVSR